MSTAVSMEPLGWTQQLRWVAGELAALALWFGLAVIRHGNVCFVWFHAYVHTWFPNDHNRGGRMTIICCKLPTSFFSIYPHFKWGKVHIFVSDVFLFFERDDFDIYFFSFWVHYQKPRTWNRRSVCRSWRAAQGSAAPPMTPRSERSARDPARQASVLSQV